MTKRMTAVIRREADGFVAICPELDVASQGDTIESARDNLREALELFLNVRLRTKSKSGLARRCL